jgi:hypothetical protein
MEEVDEYLFSKKSGGQYQYMQAAGEAGEEERPSWYENLGVGALAGLGAAGLYGAVVSPWLRENVYQPVGQVIRSAGQYIWDRPVKERVGKYPTGRPKYKTVRKGIKPALKAIPPKGKNALLIGAGVTTIGALANYLFNKPEGEVVPEDAMNPGQYDQSTVATPVTTLDQVINEEYQQQRTPGQSAVAPRPVSQPASRPTPAPARVRISSAPQPRNRVTEVDSSVLDLMSKRFGGYTPPMFQSAGQFAAYTEPSRITSSDEYEVVSPGQTFPYRFGVQSFDPSSGTYTIQDPSGKNIALDLSDLYNRIDITEKETGLPIISNYDKGIDQWKKDIVSSNVATRKKAVGHAQRAYNDARTKLNMSPYFYGKPGEDPYGIDEMLGLYTFSMPGLRKKKKAEPAAPAQASPAAPVADEINYTGRGFQGAQRPRSVGFSPQDTLAMMATMGQEIPDYMLASARMDPSLISPAYTEFDPSAVMGAYQAYLQNTGTGPQGRGAALSSTGAAGKTLEALNRERQANRASNLDTFLRTSAANQQALNQANLYNTEEGKDYINRMNTLLEVGAKQRNQKLASTAEAVAKGYTNIGKLNAVNAMMPYQYSDWLTTTVNPTLRSIYDEPITGSTGGGGDYTSIYNFVYNQLINSGVTQSEAAMKAAESASKMAASRARSGYGTSGSASSIYDFMT